MSKTPHAAYFRTAGLLLFALLVLANRLVAQDGDWELQPLQYNNPGLNVDLGVGLWAWPMPMDYDGDGDISSIW